MVCGKLMSPGTWIQLSATTHTIRVAPKMTCTSPGLSAPATTWSHMASMDPPVKTVSVPGRVPPAAHIGTTSGSCASRTPMPASISEFHFPPACRAPIDAVTPVSMAGTPESAWVATAWHGQ